MTTLHWTIIWFVAITGLCIILSPLFNLKKSYVDPCLRMDAVYWQRGICVKKDGSLWKLESHDTTNQRNH